MTICIRLWYIEARFW